MWDMLAISVLTGSVLLYLPGFMLLRACRVRVLTALACAPLVTLPVYLVLCVTYQHLGVFGSWTSLFAPPVALGALALLVCRLAGRTGAIRFGLAYSPDDAPHARAGRWWASDPMLLALYVIVGVTIAAFCFSYALDGPESFVQGFDSVHHYNVTRAFVDSGNWSPFSVTQYLAVADAVVNPLPEVSFYPAAWNCMAALLVSALGISTALAANAVNFLFVGVVFPSSMFLFMRVVFPKSSGTVAFGALCTLGFSAFPWMLMVLGPLYPNMIAFCLVPAVAFCFVSLFSRGVGWSGRAAAAALLFLGLLCFVFAQPNAVFTTAMLLAPFCVRQAVRAASLVRIPTPWKRFAQVAAAIAAIALIVGAWYILYRMPFMQGVVGYSWPPTDTRLQAFVDAISLGFRTPGAQVVLGGFIVLGALGTLHDREHFWLTCSYAFAVLVYAVSVSSDGPLQHLLSGFWYTDSARVAASAAMFGVPLASMGLWTAVRACRYVANGATARMRVPAGALTVCCAVVVALGFVLGNYYPGFVLPGHETKQTALHTALMRLREVNETQAPRIYSADEQSFVQEALRELPPNALVVNIPDDGSAFSYGLDGMRTYYRYLRTYGGMGETDESLLIRSRLWDIAEDEDVQEAVRSVGAQYVLVLDQGNSRLYSPRWFTYMTGATWRGIELIDDETPGFEIVKADGDKRLYRITAIGEQR